MDNDSRDYFHLYTTAAITPAPMDEVAGAA